jgi:hypothetical protein
MATLPRSLGVSALAVLVTFSLGVGAAVGQHLSASTDRTGRGLIAEPAAPVGAASAVPAGPESSLLGPKRLPEKSATAFSFAAAGPLPSSHLQVNALSLPPAAAGRCGLVACVVSLPRPPPLPSRS